MIIKDRAKSWISGGKPPSTTGPIEFDEMCCVCEKYIPNDALILRHIATNHIICLICLTHIAEIKE
jgi:hypothetical protein